MSDFMPPKGAYLYFRKFQNRHQSSKRKLPHVTYPPQGVGHYGHMKTLTAFDAIHPRRSQRGIVTWPRKKKIFDGKFENDTRLFGNRLTG